MMVTLNYAKEEQPIRMINNYEHIDVFMAITDGNVVKCVKQLFLVVSCSQCPLAQKVKVKAVPLQSCSGPVGSRKLRFPNFMTTGWW
jgi:hypothetical protein